MKKQKRRFKIKPGYGRIVLTGILLAFTYREQWWAVAVLVTLLAFSMELNAIILEPLVKRVKDLEQKLEELQ